MLEGIHFNSLLKGTGGVALIFNNFGSPGVLASPHAALRISSNTEAWEPGDAQSIAQDASCAVLHDVKAGWELHTNAQGNGPALLHIWNRIMSLFKHLNRILMTMQSA